MFEDELRGVGFVLTVTDVHLELVSLSVRRNKFKASVQFSMSCFKKKINLFFFFRRKVHPSDKTMANVFWKLLILLQLLQEDAEYSKYNILIRSI